MADYEIPRYGSLGTTTHGWLMNAVAEGAAWLGAQVPATQWEAVRTRLSGPAGTPLDGQSNLNFTKVKRVVREIVASLSNFRHEGEYKPRWDKELYQRATHLTQLDENWYHECKAVQRVREGVQYGVGFGTGYWYEIWDPDMHGPFKGNIKLQALPPDAVTFVQLPADHDIQRAYMTIVRLEMPINLAKATYARTNQAFADSLVPDRNNPGWIAKGLKKVQQFLAPALRVAGLSRGAQNEGSFPTVDIYHAYTADASINDTGFPMEMGAVGTNWRYTVPSLGDPIPLDQINPATNEPFTRPAEAADCQLFPLRRLTIFASSGICYDGSSPWWHGATPVAAIKFNDWAWEALGGSTPAEIMSIEDGIIALMRGIEDSAAARLDPPVLYDDQLVASNFTEQFNPRKAGARAAAQINAGKILEYPVDPNSYNVQNWIPEFIQSQEARMDYLSGVTDLVAIAKAKQVPGADTLEKLMEMAGPIVQDMVRALEEPLTQLGEWRKAYYLQFYTRPRVITITGVDGNMEDVQYVPEMLAPYIAGESAQQRSQRLRLMVDAFKYQVTESGINEIHRMTTKLYYLQLMKGGFPLSWWTMAEISKIPNFGPAPDGTHNEMQRWIAQQRMLMELQGVAAEESAAGAAAAGVPPEGSPTGQQGPGRPPSNQRPPKIEQKDGGTRSTVTTS